MPTSRSSVGMRNEIGCATSSSMYVDMTEIRKTCRRWNEVGHAHLLTFSCYQRQSFFRRDRTCLWMIDGIDRARERHRFDLWAYVIMPEHVHVLIWPTTTAYSISNILSSMKQSVSKRAIAFVKKYSPEFLGRMKDRQPNGITSYRFWQRGGGYDRNLTEPSTIWATIDYIHANPVRRELCVRPLDWLWSSAREYEEPGSGRLTVDKVSLPRTVLG